LGIFGNDFLATCACSALRNKRAGSTSQTQPQLTKLQSCQTYPTNFNSQSPEHNYHSRKMFKRFFGEVRDHYRLNPKPLTCQHVPQARRKERRNPLPQARQRSLSPRPHSTQASERAIRCPRHRRPGCISPSPGQGGADGVRARCDGSAANKRSAQEHLGVPRWKSREGCAGCE
jgi:hypothetical protein